MAKTPDIPNIPGGNLPPSIPNGAPAIPNGAPVIPNGVPAVPSGAPNIPSNNAGVSHLNDIDALMLQRKEEKRKAEEEAKRKAEESCILVIDGQQAGPFDKQQLQELASITINSVNSTADSYNVILQSSGRSMLQVIKIVKESLRLGLKEAKDIVDSAPCVITTDVPKSEAEYLKRALEEEGAKVKIEPVSVLDGPENRGKSKAEEEANRKAEEEKKRLENMPKAKELYDRGKAKTKGLFSANYKEARALFEESLALGYGDAAYEIAEMYKLGIGGCEKNLQEYLRLIDRGIELHSSYTAEKAAKDFRIGSGAVPKDKMKSSIYEGIATGIRNKYE